VYGGLSDGGVIFGKRSELRAKAKEFREYANDSSASSPIHASHSIDGIRE